MIIESITETSCCGMDELHGFYANGEARIDWMYSFYSIINAYYASPNLSAILVFTGSENQKKDRGSPFAFSRWLHRQGETVVQTRKVKNSNSGNKIQAFLWTPSAKFRKKFEAYFEKQKQEEKEIKNDENRIIRYNDYW